MIEKDIVPLGEALALYELKFDEPCLFAYNLEDKNKLMTAPQLSSYQINSGKNSDTTSRITAPFYQVVKRWFREVHKMDGWVVPYHTLHGQRYGIMIECENYEGEHDEDFESFEEAELYCVQSLIKILQDHNKEAESHG
jgi:hypothetical protein